MVNEQPRNPEAHLSPSISPSYSIPLIPPLEDQDLLSADNFISWFSSFQLFRWFSALPESVYLTPPTDVGTRFPASRNYHFPKDCDCRYDDRFMQVRDRETDKVVDIRKIPNNGKGLKTCPYHMWIYMWKLRYAVTAESQLDPLAIAGYTTKEEYDRDRKSQAVRVEGGNFGAFIGSTSENGIIVLSEVPYLERMVPVELDVGLDVVESFCMAFVADFTYRRLYPPWEEMRVPPKAMADEQDKNDEDENHEDYEVDFDRETRFEVLVYDTQMRVHEVFGRMGRHILKEDEIDEYLQAAHHREWY